MRVAFARMASNTGFNSPDDELITWRTSEVAVCRALASASSWVSALTCPCRSARVELAGCTAVGALLRLVFCELLCCAFAGLRLIGNAHRALPWAPVTIGYHIMRFVVHPSKIRCRLAAMVRVVPTGARFRRCPLYLECGGLQPTGASRLRRE